MAQHVALGSTCISCWAEVQPCQHSRSRHQSKRVPEAGCCTHNALLLYTQAKCHKATGSNAATRPEKVKHTRKPTPCKHRGQSAQGHFFHTRIKNNRKTKLHTDTPPIGRQQEQSLCQGKDTTTDTTMTPTCKTSQVRPTSRQCTCN